mmetsp:Transcript_49071/g.86412  ORF Transcript_49071/g.86412 Transcript_49071/m.86412 type:complete len:169 (-) Transcript_49071:326-832(-)
MKPAWDQLILKFEGHPTALIADVDCTAEGESLCSTIGVQGYPTIKWGDPSSLEDYEGGRDFEELLSFAEENLKPMCSPSNIDLCDEEKKKSIEGFMAMSYADLEGAIDGKEMEMKEAEETFENEVKMLQEKYEQLEKEKSDKQAEIKASGLSLMKAVLATKSPKAEEL